MRTVLYLTLLAVCVCDALGQALVKDADPKNYLNEIENLKKMVVLYYSKGEKNSEQWVHTFEQMAAQLTELGVDVPFYKLDVGAYVNIAKMHKVRKVPAVMLVHRKSVVPVGAKIKDVPAMRTWLLKKLGIRYIHVEDEEEYNQYISSFDRVFTYFGEDTDKNFASFKEICSYHSTVPCLHIDDPSLVLKYSSSSKFSIFTTFDDFRCDWGQGVMYFDVLLKFTEDCINPKVGDLAKEDQFERTFGEEKLSLVLIHNKKRGFVKEFREYALSEIPKFQKRMLYMTASSNSEVGKNLIKHFGIQAEDSTRPIIAIVAPINNNIIHYLMEGEVTPENLRKFVRNWRNENLFKHIKTKLKRTKKQQEEYDASPVKDFFAHEFDDKVILSEKDTLLYFYNPDCKFCKKFDPMFVALFESLKGNDKLNFYKFNTLIHEVPKDETIDTPSIYYFRVEDPHNPQIFMEERTLDGLIAFVKTQFKHGELKVEAVKYEEPKEEEEQDL